MTFPLIESIRACVQGVQTLLAKTLMQQQFQVHNFAAVRFCGKGFDVLGYITEAHRPHPDSQHEQDELTVCLCSASDVPRLMGSAELSGSGTWSIWRLLDAPLARIMQAPAQGSPCNMGTCHQRCQQSLLIVHAWTAATG